ncbi:MAG: hypothetical protein K5886_07820 [Lachnospiraceae bacterium]|nr:hypothetical protein [Lachnospiraceae bacterium]
MYDNGNLLALIILADYDKKGISFFTENEYSQQLAFMHHEKGHVILPHIHNEVKREVFYTKEVLVIRKGMLKCDFYDRNREYVDSYVLNGGDVILLIDGGHGFECLEETEMYEIKQGPYAGDSDKTRFDPETKEDL